MNDFEDDDDPYSGSNEMTPGTGTFAQVPGSANAWEAYVILDLNAGGNVSGSGSYVSSGRDGYTKTGGGGGWSGLEAMARLNKVAGVRVQPDL